eukprot:GSMAST32.ASY1.ANO1.2380.1 assembled CDS
MSLFLFLSLLCLVCKVKGNSMVGPGAVGSYTGRQRRQSYGRVREPAKGFFVTGSAISDMNGAYRAVQGTPRTIRHIFQLAYKHVFSGWYMGLVESPEIDSGIKRVGSEKTEWVFIDNLGRDRFGHEGATIIPGAGTRWEYLDRNQKNYSSSAKSTDTSLQNSPGLDLDELPWQVIFIGSDNMVRQLSGGTMHIQNKKKSSLHAYNHLIVHTKLPWQLIGTNGPTLFRSPILSKRQHMLLVKAEEARQRNDYVECSSILSEALQFQDTNEEIIKTLLSQSIEISDDMKWLFACIYVLKAQCDRRARIATDALQSIENALLIAPQFTRAYFERGIIFFESGDSSQAENAFETVLALDRQWPNLLEWFIRVAVQKKRGVDYYTLCMFYFFFLYDFFFHTKF